MIPLGISVLLWGLLISVSAWADNIRPVYLEIEEMSPSRIRVVWKIPRGQGLPENLKPGLPEAYRIVPPQKKLQTDDALIEFWDMIGPENGLAGAQIRIDGLKYTTTDALVRIRLSGGSVHRLVLRPTQSAATVPQIRNQGDLKNASQSPLLQVIDRLRYVLLFSVAFLLSFTARARHRGVALCTAALMLGALSGHALGRLTHQLNLTKPSIPSEAQTARILQGLMLNTYRAFMLQKDEDIYTVLARSVSGEFLSEVYLQNLESMRMRGSDGAMAVIHKLDIRSIQSISQLKDGTIGMIANWDVYGSVYHQRHVHYRCNTYKAEVMIKPIEDYWKIVRIQLLDEQRVL